MTTPTGPADLPVNDADQAQLDEAAEEYDRAVRNLAIVDEQVARLAELRRVASARVDETEAIVTRIAARYGRDDGQ